MEKFIYLNNLFDIYGELLTEKQQKYFLDYYCRNLSYGEIASKYGISRNAIFHQLKLIEDKLINLEKILQLEKKKQQINDIIDMIDNNDIKEKLRTLY